MTEMNCKVHIVHLYFDKKYLRLTETDILESSAPWGDSEASLT